jgi:alkylhydroperoxidase family enzyme|tara:strand:+ start:780 stop:1031 length:252 start_codon:yes stop_codon:yes gene_type:complete
MSRIDLVDLDIDDNEIQNMFTAVTAMLGRVPNSYKVLARSPLVAKMLVPFNAVVQREGAGSVLSTKLKEMVVIKTSHINECSY